jgi:hypothetical protein
MITAEELRKQRGGRAVVSDVTFRCEPHTNRRAPPGRGLMPDCIVVRRGAGQPANPHTPRARSMIQSA